MAASPGELAAMHAILSFPIITFIPFLLLKCYNKNDASPFDDDHIMILAFFIATLTYVAAMVTEFQLRIRDINRSNIITNVTHLSSSFASISLVIVVFPYLGLFLLVIWFGFFIKLALVDSYRDLCELFGKAAAGCASFLIRNKLLREEVNEEEINANKSSTTDAKLESIV